MKAKLLFLTVLLLLTGTIYAKNGKIKYGKHIRYEGEIVDKQANGLGALNVYDVTDKDKVIFSIGGSFSSTFTKEESNNLKKTTEIELKSQYVKNYKDFLFDQSILKVKDGIVQVKKGWKYCGDIEIIIRDYSKTDSCTVEFVLNNGRFINDENITEIVTEKITGNIVAPKKSTEISFSPSVDGQIHAHVNHSAVLAEAKAVLNFNSAVMKSIDLGGFEGNVYLEDDGSLGVEFGQVDYFNTRYNLKQMYGELFIVGISREEVTFDFKNCLYLKALNVIDDNFIINGEIVDIDAQLYQGEVSNSTGSFSGKYYIICEEADPDNYIRQIDLESIQYESGTLNIGSGNEIYNGSWEKNGNFHGTCSTKDGTYEGDWANGNLHGTFTNGNETYVGDWDTSHNFHGTYSNKELSLNLTECSKNDSIMQGIGERVFLPDSVIYNGSFIGTQRHGEGTIKYKDFTLLTGTWANDTLLAGQATLSLNKQIFPFDIKQTEEGYAYMLNGKDTGVSTDIPSLFYDLNNLIIEKFRKEILSNSDVAKANRLFKGKEFFGTVDMSILLPDNLDGLLASDFVDKIGSFCLDVYFTSQNTCTYKMYLDTSRRTYGYNSFDAYGALMGSNPLANDILIELFRAAMKDFQETTDCIYKVKGDSVLFYDANTLKFCDGMRIVGGGQKLQRHEAHGVRTISKVD